MGTKGTQDTGQRQTHQSTENERDEQPEPNNKPETIMHTQHTKKKNTTKQRKLKR
jgi:hypothetical protein